MKVELLPEAIDELLAARDHFEGEREGLGTEFLKEMRELQRQIGLRPLRFPLIQGTQSRRALGKRFPYLMVFTLVEGRAQITTVSHQHREPAHWKRPS